MVDWLKLVKCGTDTITWKLKRIPELRWINISFSQEGEDLILHALNIADKGFYVDVGCYLPKRMSNTYRLYLEGWSGLVVDLSKDCIDKFAKERPRDVGVVAAVSDKKEVVLAKFCKEGAFNSIVPDFEKENLGREAVNIVKVETFTLKELFEKNNVKKIDFLNVDCEGNDLKVLKGNDWVKFKPKVVCVEVLDSLDEVSKSPINNFLVGKGYVLVAKTPLSAFYRLRGL